MSALPKPGEWMAQTGSNEFTFTFTVNPDGTGIPEYHFLFTEFKCGGVQESVGWTATVDPMLSITGGQFNIEEERSWFDVSYPWDTVIQGQFDETGTHASGTWEISSGEGTICAGGTWEASAP
jgi:hypothetical protein